MNHATAAKPSRFQRPRAFWIAAALLLLAAAGALLMANRQQLKTAAIMWRMGPPPTGQVFAPGHTPADTLIPIHAGDQVLAQAGAQIYFSPWNWAFTGAAAVSNTPGAYFKISFTGQRLAASFNTDWLRAAGYPGSSYPVVTTIVDGGPPSRQSLSPTCSQLDLLEGLALNADPHHVHHAVVHFTATHFDHGDRWNTPVAALRLTRLDLAPGATLAAPAVRPHRLLVYGDSHSEGVELTDAGSLTAHQDARRAFPHQLARAWDAEVGVVAFGGAGYIEPVLEANLPGAIVTWDQVWNNVSRLSDQGHLVPAPDAVLSALGDNDPDNPHVSRAVTTLARAWRKAAPDAQLLFALPPNHGADGFRERLRAGLSHVTDPNLRILDPGENFLSQSALSFGNHLNADGQTAYGRALLTAYADRNPAATSATR